MSAYYYSGWREVFTVTIGTIAFFLFAYKITEKNLDNLLSIIAGLAGMMIPLFPTGIPGDITPAPNLTPIQHGLGEKPATDEPAMTPEVRNLILSFDAKDRRQQDKADAGSLRQRRRRGDEKPRKS